MKYFIHVLLLTVFISISAASQITTPIIKAGFGVDADLRARFFNGVLQTSDDWFLLAGTPGTPANGEFVIDTTGAAAIIAGYNSDVSPWPKRMASFYRTMSKPQFTTVNGRLWLDAIFVRDYHGNDTTVFTSGSDKNGMSPDLWTGGIQGIPDKNDILDIYMHVRRSGVPIGNDSLWMFGGLSLDNTTGNRYFDFEMYQTDIYYDRVSGQWYGYGVDAGHSSWQFDAAGNIAKPGDIIFSGEFQSGTLSNIEARIWVSKADWQTVVPTAFNWSGLFDGDGAAAVYGYASISPKTAGTFYTGLGSPNNAWAGPFGMVLQNNLLAFTNPAPATTSNSKYIQDQFIEFSVNLTKLGLDPVSLLGGDICGSPFNRIVVKTRASASFTAELKDFVAPTDLFLAPRVIAAAEVPIFCSDTATSIISVTNPHPTSIYIWTTPDGSIMGPDTATSILVNLQGTYIVTQQLVAGCATYASDTVLVIRDTGCSVLPGVFKTFYGSYNMNELKTELNWKVLNNASVKSFNMEKSMDGRNFKNTGIILPSRLHGEAVYKYKDEMPQIIPPFMEYRVRMNNKDGSFVYSKVLRINCSLLMKEGLMVAPNPIKDKFLLSVNSSLAQQVEFIFLDINGRPVMKMEQQVKKGANQFAMVINESWQAGVYYAVVKLNQQNYSTRFVVLK